jgi:hypothetical protein
MSTPDIIKKLRKDLDRGIASEARAVYLLTETRQLIERDKTQGRLPTPQFSLRLGAICEAHRA